MRIPESLRTEHGELHEDLARVIRTGGRTGAAAKAIAELLHPHFVREEQLVLPPLGVLTELAGNKDVGNASEIIRLAECLKVELPKMLSEHKAIFAALEQLAVAANEEGHPESARFAESLKHHARTEEEVFYPAAVLVGEYLKRISPPVLTPAHWPDRTF